MPCYRLTGLIAYRSSVLASSRLISSTAICAKKVEQLPVWPTLPDQELHYTFLKGSGPGGQKIVCRAYADCEDELPNGEVQNKTSSACQITHLPTGTVVKSQATRSKSQNYTIARRILAEKVELLQKGDESRVVKQAERAAKRKASADKKKRRKYKNLTEAQGSNGEVDSEPVGGGNHGDSVIRDGTVPEVRISHERK